ncbi:MAG: hypothetical protein NTW74_11475 [Acidobacteria bacterium]|nr:hypothetical protein [Acidobacteriota bacterium]
MTTTLDITILWLLSVGMQVWIALRIYRGDFGASFRFFALYLSVSSVVSVFLAAIPLFTDKNVLRAAIRYQESVSLGFTLFVLLFLAFVAWMPVPLTRRVLLHCFLAGAYFLSTTLSRFVVELGQYSAQRALSNYIGVGGACIVFGLWILKVQPGDDQTLNTPKGPVDPAQAAVMIARLEELNRTLARSGPKGLS